jgi:MoaA/NifB/PqqE/SkfB family radical SAM enzyme
MAGGGGIIFAKDEFSAYGLDTYNRQNGPRYLQVEVTTRCNLKCPSCIHGQEGISYDFLDIESFQSIIQGTPSVEFVSFVGMGESLLVPDIEDFVLYCSTRGMRTTITTNGTLAVRRLHDVVDAGLNKLTISIDGHDEGSFARARGGARLSKVVDFAGHAVRKRSAAFDVWAGVTLTTMNIETLPEIIRLVAETGIEDINVESVHHWGSDFSLNVLSIFTMERERVEAALEVARIEAEAKGVRVHIFDYRRIFERGVSGFTRCGWPIDGAVIRADKSVAPCCIQLQGSNRVSMGNLGSASLGEIWQSERYNDFSVSFTEGRQPSYCTACLYRAQYGR